MERYSPPTPFFLLLSADPMWSLPVHLFLELGFAGRGILPPETWWPLCRCVLGAWSVGILKSFDCVSWLLCVDLPETL